MNLHLQILWLREKEEPKQKGGEKVQFKLSVEKDKNKLVAFLFASHKRNNLPSILNLKRKYLTVVHIFQV
jgi:hypothetical protein